MGVSVFKCCAAIVLSLAAGFGARATQVTMTVVDDAGAAVVDAVVALTSMTVVAQPVARTVALDQVGKRFVPHVLAIQTGTTVYFPNSDNIRHQVYSFSDAKRFELKLYSGKTATPVQFDQPGVVVLGCNIHDWMSAYVYVLATPFFAMTDAGGHAAIQAPPGVYTLNIWHPRLARGRESVSSEVTIEHDTTDILKVLTLAAVDDANGLPPAPK